MHEHSSSAATVFAFGEFEVEPQLNQLRFRGEPVELPPRSFAVLRYLIEHRDREVGKDELLDAVWRGVAVAEGNLYTHMNLLRRALRQRPKERTPIRTEHGRGYRFVDTVQELSAHALALPTTDASDVVPLLGRNDVLAQLRLARDAAAAGRGQFRMLTGEAGIGKTRLVTELSQRVLGSATSVWVGRCRRDADAPAFWPWVELLRCAMDELPSATLRALMRTTPPELVALLPELQDLGEPREWTAPLERSRVSFFAAVQQVFVRAARTRPRVLILEDLHWADPSSARLLLHIAADIPQHRLFIVGTRRDGDQRDRAAQQALSAALALPHCRELLLSGLKRDDVADCIAALAGAPPSLRLSELVHRKTGGNPLLIQSAVQTLIRERGGEAVVDWDGRDLDWSDVARDPVRERVARLSWDARALLDSASVIGTRFELPALAEATGCAMPDLLGAIGQAATHNLVRQCSDTPWRFEFSHELIRDTLYEDIAPHKRIALHLQLARTLERRDPKNAADIRSLAFHFRHALPAGTQAEAARYAELAADSATRATAFEDAAMLYQWALEALEVKPDAVWPARIRVLQGRGKALRDSGQLVEARATFERALELARKHDDAEQFARCALLLRLSVPHLAPPQPIIERQLEQALQMLGDRNLSLRAALLAWLARNRALGHAERRKLLQQARSVHTLEPYAAFAIAESTAICDAGPDHLPALFAACDEMQQLGVRHDVPFWVWQSHLSRTRALLTVCDIAGSDHEIEAASRITRTIRWAYLVWWSELLRIQRAIGDGRFDDATAASDALARERTRDAPHVNLEYMQRLQRIEQARAQGELAKNAKLIERFTEDFAYIGNHHFWRALLFHAQGDKRRTSESLAPISHWMQRERRRGENFLYYTCSIAEMCVTADDHELGARCYELLGPYAQLNACNGVAYLGSVAHYLGVLAALLGRFESAAQHFESALIADHRMGARPALTRSRAACLRAAESAGANEAAARLETLAAEAAKLAAPKPR